MRAAVPSGRHVRAFPDHAAPGRLPRFTWGLACVPRFTEKIKNAKRTQIEKWINGYASTANTKNQNSS
jgi:hypothetical protein